MPFVLRNRTTGEIRTSMMTNIYDLPYYGTNFWETREEAERELADMPAEWEVLEVAEERLKLFNVKLRNNPRLRLHLAPDGQPEAREASGTEAP
jgi:hypothetical protein